jgi:hypothetical protein
MPETNINKSIINHNLFSTLLPKKNSIFIIILVIENEISGMVFFFFKISDVLRLNGDLKYNKFVSIVTFISIIIDIRTDGI